MHDVLVVGAGPAGNNTAYQLASLGYDVAVVDWRTRIGDKLCTGIVGRECIQTYPMDKSLIHRDAYLATLIAPGGTAIDIVRPDVQAQIVDRVAYVASFADKARQAGATYLLGHRVTELSPKDDHMSVQLTDEREKRTLRAKALVLASGFGSELNGQLGLGRVGDYVTGFQAEVVAPGIDRIRVYFGQDIAPGFFAWVVPTSRDRALIGLLGRQQGQVHLEKLILKLEEAGEITEVTKGPSRWGIPLKPLPKTYGDRLVVVGDAAGQVKPTTGGGIYYALLASGIAAEALDRGFRHNDLSAGQLSSYERQWKGLLSRKMKVGYQVRRLFEVLKDCQIDLFMGAVARNGIYKEVVESRSLSFDWHSSLILKVIAHPLLFKTLSIINPLMATLSPRT